MQYGYFDQDIRILIQFRGALNLVSPDGDTNNVKIDILGNDGAAIPNLSSVVSVDGATQYLLTVAKIAEPSDADMVRREVRSTFTYQGGLPGETRIPYTVLSYMGHGADAQAVRDYLGLTLVELPDAAVDTHAASLRALWDIGSAFSDALTDSGPKRESARFAVVLQSALDLLPSIKMRVAQSLVDGTRQFTRFSKTDIERLIYQAAEDYSYHKIVITGNAESDLGFFDTTSQADPFTG